MEKTAALDLGVSGDVVIAREGIRARMDGKILGTPVILTYTS